LAAELESRVGKIVVVVKVVVVSKLLFHFNWISFKNQSQAQAFHSTLFWKELVERRLSF
jgi:hypothetical protein